MVYPRLGQGTFRLLVTDLYGRRCVVTGERILPVLQAAHIEPFTLSGPHDPRNGLLLRSDIHSQGRSPFAVWFEGLDASAAAKVAAALYRLAEDSLRT